MLVKRILPKQKTTNATSIKEFYARRNKVLIIRNARGLGDILMHRMIFKDIKIAMPDMHLTFACPKTYHDAVKDHPFLDAVIDSNNINKNAYAVSYDTSTCCVRWECANAPFANKSRPDLWAEHCGIKLTNHNMHVPFIDQEVLAFGTLQLRQCRSKTSGPSVLFTPIAFERIRTLTDEQICGVVEFLRKKGCFVYSTHHVSISLFDKLGVPVLSGFGMHEWMSFIHAADYVITVDTAVFHYAGGIKKPMTGIFTHVDGKYRGQYYDFTLVQKHRDNGNWPCGPCFNYANCTHPDCNVVKTADNIKPCLSHLTVKEITDGIEKMFMKNPR